MNSEKVTKILKGLYPGKNIVALPENNPTEIICEVEPTADHPEYSVAMAVIVESKPHFNDVTETYEVESGSLELAVNGSIIELKEGKSYTIPPGVVHSAKSNEAWVKVESRPGWTPQSHHLV